MGELIYVIKSANALSSEIIINHFKILVTEGYLKTKILKVTLEFQRIMVL